jgi:hypothetical protein
MEQISTGSLITIITTAVITTTTLAEIIKLLVQYFVSKKGIGTAKQEVGLKADEKQKIIEIHATVVKIYDIISKTDKDSVPLCYYPRNHTEIYKVMSDLQYKVIERLAEMTSEQKRIADLLDRIERRFDARLAN